MKLIMREDLDKIITDIMDELRPNVSMTKMEKESTFLILEKHLEELCGYPDYRGK